MSVCVGRRDSDVGGRCWKGLHHQSRWRGEEWPSSHVSQGCEEDATLVFPSILWLALSTFMLNEVDVKQKRPHRGEVGLTADGFPQSTCRFLSASVKQKRVEVKKEIFVFLAVRTHSGRRTAWFSFPWRRVSKGFLPRASARPGAAEDVWLVLDVKAGRAGIHALLFSSRWLSFTFRRNSKHLTDGNSLTTSHELKQNKKEGLMRRFNVQMKPLHGFKSFLHEINRNLSFTHGVRRDLFYFRVLKEMQTLPFDTGSTFWHQKLLPKNDNKTKVQFAAVDDSKVNVSQGFSQELPPLCMQNPISIFSKQTNWEKKLVLLSHFYFGKDKF